MIDTSVGPLTPDIVVEGYLRHSTNLRTHSPDAVDDPADRDTAAYEALLRTVRHGPAVAALDLVVRLLRSAPDEEVGFHAAGPLEDLARLRGTELVVRIEAEAEADERFRSALGGVWLQPRDLPADIAQRVIRASGGRTKVAGLDAG